MYNEMLEILMGFLKWLVACIGIGGVFTIAFVNLMKNFGFELKKGRGVACWIYITLFVYGLCILLELFA